MHSRRFFAVILILWLTSPILRAQTTINVPADQPTIQAGINAASNGDTVMVAPGTYYENIDFLGKAILVIAAHPNPSDPFATIDGSKSNAPTVTFKSGETRSSILRYFTIQGGGSGGQSKALGGIYVQNSSPTIEMNHIMNNYCQGIYSKAAAPLINDNVIENTLDTPGDCTFAGGSAIWIYGGMINTNGSSTLAPTVFGNDIFNNTQSGTEGAGGDGGAGIALWGGNAIVENNYIHDNFTHGLGGGIGIENADGAIVLQNLITGNEAGGGGRRSGHERRHDFSK